MLVSLSCLMIQWLWWSYIILEFRILHECFELITYDLWFLWFMILHDSEIHEWFWIRLSARIWCQCSMHIWKETGSVQHARAQIQSKKRQIELTYRGHCRCGCFGRCHCCWSWILNSEICLVKLRSNRSNGALAPNFVLLVGPWHETVSALNRGND